MYQIDVPSASPTLPAPAPIGTPGYFTDGSVAGGVQPTVVTADWLNAVMIELASVVVAAGIAPTKGANNQLLQAIQNLIEVGAGNYATDTGVANAYVVALSPVVAAYTPGLSFRFRAAHANTAGSTVNAGAGVVPLVREDGKPVQPGDIPVNSILAVTYDAGSGGAFLINSMVPSQLGALAKLNVGAGLAVDGSGNLAVSAPGQAADLYFFGQL